MQVLPFVRKAIKFSVFSGNPLETLTVLSLIFEGTTACIVLFEPSFALFFCEKSAE